MAAPASTTSADYETLVLDLEEGLADGMSHESRIANYGYICAYHSLGKITLDEFRALRDLLGLSADDVDDLDV